MFYGPNVLFAFIGAAGVLIIVLSLMAIPHYKLTPTDDESWRARIQRKLDQADLQITAWEYVKTSLLLGVLLGAGAYVLSGAVAGAPLGLLVGFFGYYTFLEERRDKRRREYQEALLDVVNILQEAFSASNSLGMALATVAEHAPDVVRADFVEITTQVSLGASLEETLTRVAERRRDMIFDRLVEALVANQRSGGQQLGPVLVALRESVMGLAAGRRRIATAQSRIRWEARIVCSAPFVFLIMLRQTAPDLQEPFLASFYGQIAVVLVGVMSAAAYYLMNRIGAKAVAPLESAGVSA